MKKKWKKKKEISIEIPFRQIKKKKKRKEKMTFQMAVSGCTKYVWLRCFIDGLSLEHCGCGGSCFWLRLRKPRLALATCGTLYGSLLSLRQKKSFYPIGLQSNTALQRHQKACQIGEKL